MNIYEKLNQQNSLDNLVCIADITSEKKIKELEEDGYYPGFTAQRWRESFPSIDVNKIYCPKTYLFPAALIYLDWGQYIYINTMMTNGQYIKSNDTFEEDIKKRIQILEEAYTSKDYRKLLLSGASEQSGNTTMALLNKMLINEPASGELYEAFFDCYTFGDCGAKQLSPNVMQKLLQCKTQEQKRATLDSLKPFPEMITVYRGEGSQSTPYTDAYSWTVDINKAYFFASWKGGEKARIITAQVKKEDIIEYLTDRNESEIVVLPENVQNASEKQLCEMDWFLQIINSGFEGYDGKCSLEPFSGTKLSKEEKNIYQKFGQTNEDHAFEHSSRVSLFASFLYKIMILAEHMEDSKKIKEKYVDYYKKLMKAAIWHDIGREDDLAGTSHGVESYRIFQKHNVPDKVIQFLIENHCVEDNEAKSVWEKESKNDTNKDLIWTLFCILKDADALDRCRFGNLSEDNLDVNYLRFEVSKSLVAVAYTIQKYAF